MSSIPESVDEVMKEVPRSVRDLEKLPPYLMLMVLGGGLAVLLGILFGVIGIVLSIATPKLLGSAIVELIVCLIIGPLLIVSYVICKRDLVLGGVLAFVFAIILIGGGGYGGLIGGIIGLLGVIFAFLRFAELHQQGPAPQAPAQETAAPVQGAQGDTVIKQTTHTPYKQVAETPAKPAETGGHVGSGTGMGGDGPAPEPEQPAAPKA